MKIMLAGADAAHLTYCSNIHPGESWAEVRAALVTNLPEVKRRVSPDAPMGVGLRFSAEAANTLASDQTSLDWLRRFLAVEGLYVFTLNGFPYGRFHGARVKEEVYQPDWSQQERHDYTRQLVLLLAALLPADQPELEGSISTSPIGFRTLGRSPAAVMGAAEALLLQAAGLVALRRETGRSIALAIEPEPMCLLETIAETAEFFEAHLLSASALAHFSALTGLARGAAEEAIRRHVGVCYDVCHAAVEFEPAGEALARLRRSDIRVAKLQLSSALRLPRLDTEALARLRAFDEGVYLHQVVERRPDGRLIRFLDLPEAFAAHARDLASGDLTPREWRVHFHVPVFQDDLGAFTTTQGELVEILALQKAAPITRHLEVETYTWDVLPPTLRTQSVTEAIARELKWVRGQLGA
jgi:hypothetical protein